MSEGGPKQGDPLGSLVFCDSIHPLHGQMKASLIEGYIDDMTLGGRIDTVAGDVAKLASSRDT